MIFNPNGVIIQSTDRPTLYVSGFTYLGVKAYHQYPLSNINDALCREITKRVYSKIDPDGYYTPLSFISDESIYREYVEMCRKHSLSFRSLFIESQYSDEIWSSAIPQKTVLGYEYCSIPLDSQIITDLDWYKPLAPMQKKLNQFGLFRSLDDVLCFKDKYDDEWKKGNIGDGEMDTYILRVSLITD